MTHKTGRLMVPLYKEKSMGLSSTQKGRPTLADSFTPFTSARVARRSPRDECGGTCRQAVPSAPYTSRRAS